MRNLETLPAEKLLAVNTPEALFSQSALEAKQEYRTLARRWHPDHEHSALAPRVFAHVAQLYQFARKKLAEGIWNEPGEKIEDLIPGLKKFKLIDGSIKTCAYEAVRPFELGCMYISDHYVVFEIEQEFQDLFQQGRRQIRNLCFRDDAMALEMSKFLPQITDSFRTNNANVLVLRKTPDQLLLRDVLSHFGGKIEPIEHVGWIVNVLLNLACYLDWAGITHNAITPHSFFVSPLRHSGMLLGGWWYATQVGERIQAVPNRSLDYIPPDILQNRRADTRADLELIKSIGRELLGDASGARLMLEKSLPSALVEWLCLPSNGSAPDDYSTWRNEVLPDAFGPPRFVTLRLEAKDLYKED